MPPINKKGDSSKYTCTAAGCQAFIRSSFDAKLHPLLKVLICRKCYKDYGTGDFSLFNDPEVGPGVDELGDDNFCRWCVDGGDLFACANNDLEGSKKCHYAFCIECIKRNCPNEEVLNQENFAPDKDFRWLCFSCAPEKLKKLRLEAQEIILSLAGKDLNRPPASNNVSTSRESPIVTGNRTTKNHQADSADANRQPINDTTRSKLRAQLRQREKDKDNDQESDSQKSIETSERQRTKEKEAREKAAREKEAKEREIKEKEAKEKEAKEKEAKEKETKEKETKEKEAKEKEARDRALKEKGEKEKEAKEAQEKVQQTTKERDSGVKEKSNDKDKNRDRESSFSDTGDVQVPKKRKTDSSSFEPTITREPEACSMPQVAPPKPAETTLRRLSKKFATPDAARSNLQRPNTSSVPPKSTQTNIQSRFPSSVNNVTRIRPTSSTTNLTQMQEVNMMNSNGNKPKSLSKQLKPPNEQIKPSCKVPLSDIELRKRLENYRSLSKNCVNEISTKFENVFEMFLSKQLGENHTILKFEIDDLKKPLSEMTTMLRDLESLYHSQH